MLVVGVWSVIGLCASSSGLDGLGLGWNWQHRTRGSRRMAADEVAQQQSDVDEDEMRIEQLIKMVEMVRQSQSVSASVGVVDVARAYRRA